MRSRKMILDDIHRAIQTIQRRSEGLIRFVSDFRNLTRIPIPQIKEVKVKEIFQRVLTLLKHDLDQFNINVITSVKPAELSHKGGPGTDRAGDDQYCEKRHPSIV